MAKLGQTGKPDCRSEPNGALADTVPAPLGTEWLFGDTTKGAGSS